MVQREHQVANPERTEIELSEKVREIDKKLIENPDDAMLWMERGVALSEMFLMREAVEAFSKTISLEPFCGMAYRHRAHRHLSCWEIQEACADAAFALRLLPDNWDNWYHLALSHYLLGEYEKAEKAYEACYNVAFDYWRLPTTNWYWAALMRQGKKEAAAKILDRIDESDGIAVPGEKVSRDGYFACLSLYKGWITPGEMEAVAEQREVFNKLIRLYSLSNYYFLNGDLNNSNRLIDQILLEGASESWPTFAYLAAMADKKTRSKA